MENKTKQIRNSGVVSGKHVSLRRPEKERVGENKTKQIRNSGVVSGKHNIFVKTGEAGGSGKQNKTD